MLTMFSSLRFRLKSFQMTATQIATAVALGLISVAVVVGACVGFYYLGASNTKDIEKCKWRGLRRNREISMSEAKLLKSPFLSLCSFEDYRGVR